MSIPQKIHSVFMNQEAINRLEECTLQPIERCKIACWADKVGIIPIIGTPVGAIRIVCSVTACVLSLLAALATTIACRSDLREKCIFVAKCSCDEFWRGFIELIPGWMWYHSSDREECEQTGILTNVGGAYGHYIYKNSSNFLLYSKEKYEQLVWVAKLYDEKHHVPNGVYAFLKNPILSPHIEE